MDRGEVKNVRFVEPLHKPEDDEAPEPEAIDIEIEDFPGIDELPDTMPSARDFIIGDDSNIEEPTLF